MYLACQPNNYNKTSEWNKVYCCILNMEFLTLKNNLPTNQLTKWSVTLTMDNQPAWWRCISCLIWAKTCIFPSMLWLCMLYIQIRIYESPVYVPSRCHRSINRNSYIICVKKSEIFLSCGLYTSINHNQNAQLLVSGVTWWTMCQISDGVWKLSVTLKKKTGKLNHLTTTFSEYFFAVEPHDAVPPAQIWLVCMKW